MERRRMPVVCRSYADNVVRALLIIVVRLFAISAGSVSANYIEPSVVINYFPSSVEFIYNSFPWKAVPDPSTILQITLTTLPSSLKYSSRRCVQLRLCDSAAFIRTICQNTHSL